MKKSSVDIDMIKNNLERCTIFVMSLGDMLDNVETTQIKSETDEYYTDKAVLHELKRTMPMLQLITNTLDEQLKKDIIQLENMADY